MTNLPAIVEKVGGALLHVLLDLEPYIGAQRLDRRDQIRLARIVEADPALNTEPRVGLIVDMMVYHGQSVDMTIRELLDNGHAIEDIYLAIDYLYEFGERDGRDGSVSRDLRSAERFVNLVELITQLKSIDINVDGLSSLGFYVVRAGGLDECADLTGEAFDAVVGGEDIYHYAA